MTNFERFKCKIYNFILTKREFELSCVGPFKWLPEYENAKKDLNTWLDNLDIRSVSYMVPELVDKGCKLPKYLKTGKYTIDYNKNDQLDILPIKMCNYEN